MRIRDRSSSDENGYAIAQKVKVWDEDEEDWFSAIIDKTQGQQYFVQYVGYESYDEWVDLDEICGHIFRKWGCNIYCIPTQGI